MHDTDRDYFLRRAEAELELAQAAEHERAVRSHFLMAGVYLDRVYGHPEEAGPANA
jgi:hypothetical protein